MRTVSDAAADIVRRLRAIVRNDIAKRRQRRVGEWANTSGYTTHIPQHSATLPRRAVITSSPARCTVTGLSDNINSNGLSTERMFVTSSATAAHAK